MITTGEYQPVITPADVFEKSGTFSNGFIKCMNVFGFYYFFVMTLLVYLAIIFLAPDVYDANSSPVMCLATYSLFSILANFFLCRTYKPFYTPTSDINLPQNVWRQCSYCQHPQPPRCHHCPLCHHCIPKRDHHCFFTGICIGELNQGYFAIYCLHCAVGLLLGFSTLSDYLSSTYYEVFSLDFYHYFPPFSLMKLITGYLDYATFYHSFLLVCSFFTGIFSLFLFIWELVLIAGDLTPHELSLWWSSGKRSWAKIRPLYNFQKTFGSYWFLNFLIPMPGRGISHNHQSILKQLF